MKKMTGKFMWVVVVIVAAVGVYLAMGDKVDQYTNNLDSILPDSQSKATPVPASSVKKKAVAPVTSTPSAQAYGQLVKEFEGRRIQFDQRCQPVPLAPTYKNGTVIMLDNRAPSARVITIGTNQYSVAGYGYQIVTVSSPSLPNELSVGCNSSGNVGKILLQAKILQ
ncbi:MAG: hypothetical protein Q8R34_01360 [bacterium]|nr:hypothetical protein [bacterium]